MTPRFQHVEGLVRLRNGSTVVGYERPTPLGAFHSEDGLWWRGKELDHTERDASIGQLDKLGRPLFVGDILTVKVRRWFASTKTLAVVERPDGPQLIDVRSKKVMEIAILTKDSDVELKSFVFLNPHLDL